MGGRGPRLLDAAGLARRGDRDAVRWIAVSHAHRRVDIVATLVRQDGRTEVAGDDRRGCAMATRALERRMRLRTPAPGRTPPSVHGTAPGRGAPLSSRDRLRRHVRAAAIVAADEDDFIARLRGAGLRVRLRLSRADGTNTSYAVSFPDPPATGRVWYSGGQLAHELSLPHLRTRWAHTPQRDRVQAAAEHRQQLWHETAEAVSTTTATSGGDTATTERGHAIADVLTATASIAPPARARALLDAADLLHRASGHPHRSTAPDARAAQLRSLARLIGLIGQLSDDQDGAAALHLVYLVAGFAENLASLRQARQQRGHAAAAYTAAAHLYQAVRCATPPSGDVPPEPPAVQMPPGTPRQGHRRRYR